MTLKSTENDETLWGLCRKRRSRGHGNRLSGRPPGPTILRDAQKRKTLLIYLFSFEREVLRSDLAYLL